jgi:hypothetical protein
MLEKNELTWLGSDLSKRNDVTDLFRIAKIDSMCKVSRGTYGAKEADMTKAFDGVGNSNIAQLSTFVMPDSAVTSNCSQLSPK